MRPQGSQLQETLTGELLQLVGLTYCQRSELALVHLLVELLLGHDECLASRAIGLLRAMRAFDLQVCTCSSS